MKQQPPSRKQFVGIKMSEGELCALQRAARKAPSISEFIRAAVAKAIAEQQAGAAQ